MRVPVNVSSGAGDCAYVAAWTRTSVVLVPVGGGGGASAVPMWRVVAWLRWHFLGHVVRGAARLLIIFASIVDRALDAAHPMGHLDFFDFVPPCLHLKGVLILLYLTCSIGFTGENFLKISSLLVFHPLY